MKKILISFLLFFAAVSAYSSEELIELLEETTAELEESTRLIEELKEENQEIKEQRDKYERLLEETTDELESSTELIIELREELAIAQSEIEFFRSEYEEALLESDGQKPFAVGLGITYPYGGELIATIIPPILNNLQFYVRGGIDIENISPSVGTGLMLRY